MCLRVTAIAAFIAFIGTVQGHQSPPFDLHNTTAGDQLSVLDCEDIINNATLPSPTSLTVELFPANELRVTLSDRKQVGVHVTVGVGEVAPPRGRATNCFYATENGYSRSL